MLWQYILLLWNVVGLELDVRIYHLLLWFAVNLMAMQLVLVCVVLVGHRMVVVRRFVLLYASKFIDGLVAQFCLNRQVVSRLLLLYFAAFFAQLTRRNVLYRLF